jgi:uncharacterized protein (TIGR03435 family)
LYVGPRGGEQMIENKADLPGTPIFVALPQQLGLKLVGGKSVVKLLAIDKAELPAAN